MFSSYTFSTTDTSFRRQFSCCTLRWSPSELLSNKLNAYWSHPLSTSRHWAQTSRECRLPPDRKHDFQDNLQDLLQLLCHSPELDSQRLVNRAICRTRRRRKRFVRSQVLTGACATGRAPLFRINVDMSIAQEPLTPHYSAIFEFDRLEEAARESAVRRSSMQSWLSRPYGT